MSRCPVGKLGRHDMQLVGDVLRCRWCPATSRRLKRQPNIVLAPRRFGKTW